MRRLRSTPKAHAHALARSLAPMRDPDTLATLQAENARLIALLEAHGIDWRRSPEPRRTDSGQDVSGLSTTEKVTLFRRLFRGRVDVYPVRWENKKSGKSGYTPACANEWRNGVCDKRRVKCADCAIASSFHCPIASSTITWRASVRSASIHCSRMIAAIFSRSISTRRNGAWTP